MFKLHATRQSLANKVILSYYAFLVWSEISRLHNRRPAAIDHIGFPLACQKWCTSYFLFYLFTEEMFEVCYVQVVQVCEMSGLSHSFMSSEGGRTCFMINRIRHQVFLWGAQEHIGELITQI